jgi:hypothetical protein
VRFDNGVEPDVPVITTEIKPLAARVPRPGESAPAEA